MTIADLNARFGAPGRIVFKEGFAGYPSVVLASKYGSAEVALLGANVLDYRPTGHAPVLFRPARRDYNRGETMHGGIPLCWPQFGNRFSKALPPHGFASKLVFEVRASEYSAEMAEITLGLKSDALTKSVWPHDFDLTYRISVSMKLNLTLTTRNTGDAPFDFSCGVHPYLRVRDCAVVRLRGLAGCAFTDTLADATGAWEGDVACDAPRDHVFAWPPAPKHEVALLDEGLGRALAVVSSGHGCEVVWRPASAESLPDLDAGDENRFVCVEPVSSWPGGLPLRPNEEHTLAVAVQATLK